MRIHFIEKFNIRVPEDVWGRILAVTKLLLVRDDPILILQEDDEDLCLVERMEVNVTHDDVTGTLFRVDFVGGGYVSYLVLPEASYETVWHEGMTWTVH